MQVPDQLLVRCPDCGQLHRPLYIGKLVDQLFIQWLADNSSTN
jgi:hypothetical protein